MCLAATEVLQLDVIEWPGGFTTTLLEIVNHFDPPGRLIQLIGLFLPALFILLSLVIKQPFSIGIKLWFLLQFLAVLLAIHIINFGFEVERYQALLEVTTSYYPLVMAYLWIVFIFGLWSALLATPLSNYKVLNWIFEKREGYEPPVKHKPYISKSGRTRPSNKYYGK